MPGSDAMDRLRRTLYPASVAVVGASRDPTKRGHQVIRSLLDRGFSGALFPVNPRGEEILGLPTYRTIAETPVAPDLAVLCTRAAEGPELLEACGRRGVSGAVVLAAGFRELGAEGSELEDRLRAAAARSGIRVVGPNTSGFMNLGIRLDLIGIPQARPGRLALLVQSGNVLLDLVKEASDRPGQGFSVAVGVGNEADAGFGEYLELLAEDAGIGGFALHAESFRGGAAFLEAARRISRLRPIVALKGGRTRAGDQAARSHTGALAADHSVVRAAFRRAGIVEVTRSDDLLPVTRALEAQPPALGGEGMVILADGGGHGTLAADALDGLGIPLSTPAPGTRSLLRELLGPNGAVGNPVDLAGAADRHPELFPRVLEALMADPGVSGVLMVSLFGGYAIRFAEELEAAETLAAQGLASAARTAGKPLLVHSIYAESGSHPLRFLEEAGIPIFRSVEGACRAAAAAWERGRFLAREEEGGERDEAFRGIPDPPPPSLLRSRTAGPLLETEARELLARYGVPMVPGRLCTSGPEVEEAFLEFGPPVVLKAVSGTVTHKTEAGGVELGIGSRAEARRAFDRIRQSVADFARRQGWEPELKGVLVSPMLPAPPVEFLAGVRRDRTFGPIVTLGAGGVAVEVLRDVAVRILPLGPGELEEMVDELRIAPLLRGHRGRPGVDLPALEALLLGLARCLLEHPEVTELELNPVFAGPDGVRGVDARGFLEPAPSSGSCSRTAG